MGHFITLSVQMTAILPQQISVPGLHLWEQGKAWVQLSLRLDPTDASPIIPMVRTSFFIRTRLPRFWFLPRATLLWDGDLENSRRNKCFG